MNVDRKIFLKTWAKCKYKRKDDKCRLLDHQEFHRDILNNSLKNGDLKTIKLLHTKGIEIPEKSLKLVYKHLNVIKWLSGNTDYDLSYCYKKAILGNRTEIINFLENKYSSHFEFKIKHLIHLVNNKFSSIEKIKYFRMDWWYTIQFGNLNLVKYLISKNKHWGTCVFFTCIALDRLDILQYFCEILDSSASRIDSRYLGTKCQILDSNENWNFSKILVYKDLFYKCIESNKFETFKLLESKGYFFSFHQTEISIYTILNNIPFIEYLIDKKILI